MAAKVKLLQRELKTVKADMAFSKERCAQLEEENRQLRDGNHDADEDMVFEISHSLLFAL
jgi:cell division protein FtsB